MSRESDGSIKENDCCLALCAGAVPLPRSPLRFVRRRRLPVRSAAVRCCRRRRRRCPSSGVTKGWALGHSIPERIFKAHTKNYLKMYYAIKTYLDTQHVKMLSFNMVPTPTTTVISMNIFWCDKHNNTTARGRSGCECAVAT